MPPRVQRTKLNKVFPPSSVAKKAYPWLLRDFAGRCAYSMMHEKLNGKLEVDHFRPKSKGTRKVTGHYRNLFPAWGHCNRSKGDFWPTRRERSLGIRLLDCTSEDEYLEGHIKEDPASRELVGLTPEGRTHIAVLDLNSPHLVNQRKLRAEILMKLSGAKRIKGKSSFEAIAEQLAVLREQLCFLIPELPLLEK